MEVGDFLEYIHFSDLRMLGIEVKESQDLMIVVFNVEGFKDSLAFFRQSGVNELQI